VLIWRIFLSCIPGYTWPANINNHLQRFAH
jgi:hypothetical protein